MDSYKLGKDIQEIKQRLKTLEKAIGVGETRLRGRVVQTSTVSVEGALVEGDFAAEAAARCKSGRHGRMDAAECECREQTLTVCSDGTYTYVAVHHNGSRLPDDGDTHRLTVHIKAGDQIIHSFGSERFVPRGTDRTKEVTGESENIRRRYEEIDNWSATLECD